MRALKVVRQSSTSDDAVSPEAQDKSISSYLSARDWTSVGSAVDLDTSASIPPQERPELGLWLSRPEEYDALVVWRLDRLARSTLDFAVLLDWASKNNKTVVSVTEGFDLSTPVGQMTAKIIMVFAEFELASIKQRTRETRQALKRSGRFPGGRPPYGYRPVKRSGGAGWTLEIDPEAAGIIREVATRITAGESPGMIAADLNARGVPSPDVWSAKQTVGVPKNPRGKDWNWSGQWVPSRISLMIGSYALRGYAMENVHDTSKTDKRGRGRVIGRQPVLDDEGQPVIRGPEILDAEDFRAVRAALRERANKYSHKNPRRGGAIPNLLHHVVFCAECDHPLYVMRKPSKSGPIGRYRCQGKDEIHRIVTTVSVRQDELEDYVTKWFLRRYGRMEWVIPVYDPGENHDAALAEVNERIERLETDRYIKNRFSTPDGEKRYHRIMDQLEAERARLESLPSSTAGYTNKHTGRTVAEEWNRREAPGRAEILRQFRVRAVAHVAPRGTPLVERVTVDIRKPESQEEADADLWNEL